ncbi:hypothetical protein [Stigmatella aurantiaca]|uniref:Conserved uncharacterized protein n=1 Tax=Stigmatella aurantiaca (strain DW4/3-1) TaxID=378806 RepID=Q08UU2_STIAD|nr:hypothetical protein [Stigmatella aurantiaca]ADO68278.1 conserved uncharacterized protein [Stigmatella aurantiaca DW4/3-1]EAU64269.1 hypothetical protein STIAU_1738 [Stigmatella aurantiaca DW4/3-1]
MRTVTYERSGRMNTGAQALRVEGLHHLRILEQGEEVAERELTEDEVLRLKPLMEEAARQPSVPVVEPDGGGPEELAVSLAFEDEAVPRVRLGVERFPARGMGSPYDELLEELDTLLTAELHTRVPRHAHAVLPHMLRVEE